MFVCELLLGRELLGRTVTGTKQEIDYTPRLKDNRALIEKKTILIDHKEAKCYFNRMLQKERFLIDSDHGKR
jgi:hypothetical protein